MAAQLINLKERIQYDVEVPYTELLSDSENARTVLFCLKKGQKLEPHVASSDVGFFSVEGEGQFIVGEETLLAKAGCYVHVPARVPHGAIADSDFAFVAVIAPRPR